MKRALINVGMFIGSLLIGYLLMAFVIADFNILAWDKIDRIVCEIIGLCLFVILLPINSYIEDN